MTRGKREADKDVLRGCRKADSRAGKGARDAYDGRDRVRECVKRKGVLSDRRAAEETCEERF